MTLSLSVIIATYNRADLIRRLVQDLLDQTLAKSDYEVIVVDDGSKEDMRPLLADLAKGGALRVERQSNAGAGAARQRGAELAKGRVLVFLDDDMRVRRDFLAAHLAARTNDTTVVLGRLLPADQIATMPLFERFFATMLDRMAEGYSSGMETLRGSNVYTGNVSVPRALFFDVGGFDTEFRALEDQELGIRLERAGATFVFSNEACSVHGSDKTSMEAWMKRSYRDGVFETRVGRKHADLASASPFRHIARINPISKPFLALSFVSPATSGVVADVAIRAAALFDKVGVTPLAIAGATLVYGMQYYRGVRAEAGDAKNLAREYGAFRKAMAHMNRETKPRERMLHAIREDHAMLKHYTNKYDGRGAADESMLADGVKKIGFQVMVAYRVMRFFRESGNLLAAQFVSRMIRHLYSSDIHWDAEFDPGVVIVHGFGLAISYGARVSRGCILFQHVTLGHGSEAASEAGDRKSGAPLLRENVHVGIGATLFGPIEVGEGSKIMAGCVVGKSVPARSVVEAPEPHVVPRVRQKG